MKTKTIKNICTILAAAAAVFLAGCAMSLEEPTSSADLRNISGLKNRSAVTKMPFMGGAALYNPSDLQTSQLAKGVTLAVRLGKIQKKDVGSGQFVYGDLDTESVFGYIAIEDISRESVSFSYYEFENERWSISEEASLKNRFTLEAGKSCDLNSDGINDIAYIKPFAKRKGSEKAMWLAFLNEDENIKTSSMFSIIPQQYARSAYPGGLIGINPDGRYIVNKYDVGTTNRAAIKSLAYGDYVIDNEESLCQTYVGTRSFSGARAVNDDELETMDLSEDDSPEIYYFQNAEFAENYSIYELLEAMPSSVVTKEFKSLSIADAVSYLNEIIKNPDLWKKLVEGNSSDEAQEIRDNLSNFAGETELHIVIANRKALSVLYPDLCPELSFYSTSFSTIFPWFYANLGDMNTSGTENSARAATKKENPILSDARYTEEYKNYIRKRDNIMEEFSQLKSLDVLPCIVGILKSPFIKQIVKNSDASIRVGIGGKIKIISATPNFDIKMCLLFKYEFKDAIKYNINLMSIFTSDENPTIIDPKTGEGKSTADFKDLDEAGMKKLLAENKKALEDEFGINEYSALGFKEAGDFSGSLAIKPTKDAKNFHKAINLCPPFPVVFSFDASFDVLLYTNVLVEFKNAVVGGILMVGFGVSAGIDWSFVKKWKIPVNINANPYCKPYKIFEGANFAGITTKNNDELQLGGGIQAMIAPVIELRAGVGIGGSVGIASADFTLGAPIRFVLPISSYLGITTGNGNIINFVTETQGNFLSSLGLDLQFCLDPPILKKRTWKWPLWTALDFNAQLWKTRTENGTIEKMEGPKIVSYKNPFSN